MSILKAVEASLKDFRPKTHRQFVALNVASRFDDVRNLARYLNVCDHPAPVLLDAARLAEQRALSDGANPIGIFFDLLADWQRKEAA